MSNVYGDSKETQYESVGDVQLTKLKLRDEQERELEKPALGKSFDGDESQFLKGHRANDEPQPSKWKAFKSVDQESAHGLEKKGKRAKIVLWLCIVLLLLSAVGLIVAFSIVIPQLESDVSSLEESQSEQPTSDLVGRIEQGDALNSLEINASLSLVYELLSRQETMLAQSLTSMENLTQQLNASMERLSLVDQLASQILALNSALEEFSSRTPPISCATLPPSYPTDYYYIPDFDWSPRRELCDMNLTCGNITGGWTRAVYLDMTNSSHFCPFELTKRVWANGTTATCVLPTSSPGCVNVTFPVTSRGYREVCGRVIGYQIGSTDSFRAISSLTPVDGVILSYGDNHLWTFAAGLDEVGSLPGHNCICNTANRTSPSGVALPPQLVGEHYFCDTGASGRFKEGVFYGDALWDGAGCEGENSCCIFNDPPWFIRHLPEVATEDIVMQLCRDESANNEDVAVQIVEVFVQ